VRETGDAWDMESMAGCLEEKEMGTYYEGFPVGGMKYFGSLGAKEHIVACNKPADETGEEEEEGYCS
jgi:hypothetical protein